MTSLGHASSGTGASGIIRFGDPGVLGEWIWLSNRYKPPVAELFALSLKVPAKGVGMEGSAGWRVDDPPIPNWLLNGVPGEASEASSMLETERFRDLMLLRLEAEKFFRRPGGRPATDGEPDRGSMSCPNAGKGGVAVSSRMLLGAGDGAGLADTGFADSGFADNGFIVRLGPADNACRCCTI